MAKKTPAQARVKGEAKSDDTAKSGPRDNMRETVESIVIAFVLAFLFRTFEAEAFVIPTGSMAPTLMGRHKDLICSNCNYPYRVSASDEEPRDGQSWRKKVEQEADSQRLTGRDRDEFISRHTARVVEEHQVAAAICPICRYQMDFTARGREAAAPHASYKGDRILVAKFPYEFSDPKRWDVAVFKNPHQAKENYIKRVVGLPNETVVIGRGDVHTTQNQLDEEPLTVAAITELRRAGILQIERKPPAKVEAMLQVVHDNNYLPPRVPPRWEPQTPGWQVVEEGRGFEYDGKTSGDAMLLYNHLLPTPAIWQRLQDEPQLSLTAEDMPAQLITDFYAYNTNESRPRSRIGLDDEVFGNHWVGDLAIECCMQVKGSEGEAILQLVEGGQVFECRIDVATGQARFDLPGIAAFDAEAQTSMRGPGTYRLKFANVDDQLLLWVNGKSVAFDGRFGPLGNLTPKKNDLAPARLGANALAVHFNELRLLRDVYYIATRTNDPEARNGSDLFSHDFINAPAESFTLSADQFLVLGDNSPRSADSRFWPRHEYYVKRELLVGKAVYIYWPHALPIPGLPDRPWFQLIPNVARMGFVR